MKLVEHSVHKGLYYLEWPDGSRSDDFYNKTRANWYRRNLQRAIDDNIETLGVAEPSDAFNGGARYHGSSQ